MGWRALDDMGPRGGGDIEKEVDAVAQDVLIGRLRAAIGHVRELDAGQLGGHRHGDVLAGALAARRVCDLLRVGARKRHQFFEVLLR
jgi:hypothetical protein